MGSRPAAVDNATCETCGKRFHVKPSVLIKGNGKYCSKGCVRYVSGPAHPLHGKVRSIGTPRDCVVCGVEFLNRRTRVKFCSRKCFHRYKNQLQRRTSIVRKVGANGYVYLRFPDGRDLLEHRYLWAKANGEIPAGAQIHHRNGIKTDNRLENLQLALTPQDHCDAHGGAFRSYPRRMADCHPDLKHHALGLCRACYHLRWRQGRAAAA
jgi:hypothetical protein